MENYRLQDLINTLPPDELNAFLSQSTIRSSGYGEPPQQMPQQRLQSALEPQQTMPQNYVRNNSTGNVTNLDYAAQPQYGGSQQGISSGMPALDYSSAPVEMGGVKGYRAKGDPFTVYMQDGTKLSLVTDQKATRERRKEDLALYNQTPQAAYDKRIMELKAEEIAANQPGTQAYKRIQEEKAARRKEEAIVAKEGKETTDAKNYVLNQMKVLDKSVEDVITSPGVDSATGWWDNMTANWMSLTPSDKVNARAYIKQLQEVSQVVGLSELRKAGIAPGSITEREWPKFQAMLGNINPDLSDDEFMKQMTYISGITKTARSELGDRSSFGGYPSDTPSARTTSRAEVQALAAKRGIPIAQVIADAKARGYTIGD